MSPEEDYILIRIKLQFVNRVPTNNMLALVKIISLVPNSWQAIIYTNYGLLYRFIYALFGPNELNVADVADEYAFRVRYTNTEKCILRLVASVNREVFSIR